MTTLYYTFESSDQRIGYFEITQEPDTIYQKAQFQMGDNEIINTFQLKLGAGNVTAFKYLDGDWVDLAPLGDNYYPNSAYPLLLEKANPTFTYHSIEEGSATITGEMVLQQDDDHITETQEGKTVRQFWLEDGRVTQIDWGGAISKLCESREEAVAGTSYDIV